MTATSEAPSLTIRPLSASDSIEALTALLHRAYAGLGARGPRQLQLKGIEHPVMAYAVQTLEP